MYLTPSSVLLFPAERDSRAPPPAPAASATPTASAPRINHATPMLHHANRPPTPRDQRAVKSQRLFQFTCLLARRHGKMASAPLFQLKIKYDVDKYGAVFVSADEALRFSREILNEKIRSVTARFIHVKDVKIKYLDDEKNFVNLPPDESAMSELFRCAISVDNAEFKRITIVVEESFSPLPASALLEDGKKNFARKRTSGPKSAFSPTSVPSASKREHCTPSVSRKSLDFQNTRFTGHPFGTAAQSAPLFKSPLEKFLESQREKISSLEVREKQISSHIANYPTSTANTSLGSVKAGPTCSNCHRQERHNRLNCPYNSCETVFHCGAINKHPEEKAKLKGYEKQRQDIIKEMSRVKQKIDVKEKAAKSIQERYVNKVRHQLIESIPERYLDVGKEGNTVENWFQLNRDAKKLEVKLKGKVPPPYVNLKELLEEADENESSSYGPGKTSVRNPYKKLWEDRGVKWPSSDTVNHEDYLLAMGIEASMNTSQDKDIRSQSTSVTSKDPSHTLSDAWSL